MRYLRYGLLAIGITLMPLLTALVLQVQAAPPSKLALAAQATALATPAAPQAQAGLTSQDRQRLTYVGLAADAMASVVDVLQIEAGALLPLPASAPAGQTGATPGAASTTVAPVGTPGAGTTPSSLGAGAVALTPAATLGATTSAAGATVAPVGTPGAGTTPSSLGAGAVALTPAATLGASTGAASTTVAPATSGQTQAPALPTVTIARPLELIDFIGRMRIILRTASDGLDTLD